MEKQHAWDFLAISSPPHGSAITTQPPRPGRNRLTKDHGFLFFTTKDQVYYYTQTWICMAVCLISVILKRFIILNRFDLSWTQSSILNSFWTRPLSLHVCVCMYVSYMQLYVCIEHVSCIYMACAHEWVCEFLLQLFASFSWDSISQPLTEPEACHFDMADWQVNPWIFLFLPDHSNARLQAHVAAWLFYRGAGDLAPHASTTDTAAQWDTFPTQLFFFFF